MKPKLLVVELWGLGDLTFATSLIEEALPVFDIVVLGKPHARQLLQRHFPSVRFIEFDAPWTVFRGKYRLWKWPWLTIVRILFEVRRQRFDAAVSVRRDPRDHLLMRLSGAKRRVGFSAKYSYGLLSDMIRPSAPIQHRVLDWRELAVVLGLPGLGGPALPTLQGTAAVEHDKPVAVLHAGARIATRRWPESSFAWLIERIRSEFNLHLILVPDPDGYGSGLSSLADVVKSGMTIPELVDLLGESDLLICNDSGPMHIAAAVGTPTIAFFGPTDSRVFGPWGDKGKVIERDLCEYRPCFDYCRFAENYCLTKLHPENAWTEVREFLEKLLPHSLSTTPAGGVPA